MADCSEHKARALRNEALCAHLRSTAPLAFPDWEVVSLFYAAVHLVEALLATRGVHSNDHHERRRQVLRILPAAHGAYRQLEILSRDARYSPEGLVTTQRVATAAECLRQIKTEVRRQLP